MGAPDPRRRRSAIHPGGFALPAKHRHHRHQLGHGLLPLERRRRRHLADHLAQDDTLRTAWGSGSIGCGTKVSYGVAAITSAAPSTALRTISCGPAGQNKGKIMRLLAAGENLYAVLAAQGTRSGYPVWRSTDGGRVWQTPSWSFPWLPDAFVQFGQANAQAPDGYAYLLDARDITIHLM